MFFINNEKGEVKVYCAYCGKEIPNKSIFCRHCAKKQDNFSSSNKDKLTKKIVSQSSSCVQQQTESLQNKRKYHAIEAIMFIAAFFIIMFTKCGSEIKDAFYNIIPRENPIQAAAKSRVSKEVVSSSSIRWKTVDIL